MLIITDPRYTGMTMPLAGNWTKVGQVCRLRVLGSREGRNIPGRVCCRGCVPWKVNLASWGVHLTK